MLYNQLDVFWHLQFYVFMVLICISHVWNLHSTVELMFFAVFFLLKTDIVMNERILEEMLLLPRIDLCTTYVY